MLALGTKDQTTSADTKDSLLQCTLLLKFARLLRIFKEWGASKLVGKAMGCTDPDLFKFCDNDRLSFCCTL